MSIWDDFWDTVTGSIETVKEWIGKEITHLWNWIISEFGKVKTWVGWEITHLWNWAISEFGKVKGWIGQEISYIWNWAVKESSNIWKEIHKLWQSIYNNAKNINYHIKRWVEYRISDISNFYSKLDDSVKSLLLEGINKIKDFLLSWFLNIILIIITGIIEGIDISIQNTNKKIREMGGRE